jgi:hypothetical protein
MPHNNTGAKVGAEFRINTTTLGAQTTPVVAGLQNSGFVVAWASAGQDTPGSGIYAQLFTANGTRSGAEFRVNTRIAGDQITPAVASSPQGGFVVTWASAAQDGSGAGVYGQRYYAAGRKAAFEWRVNTSTADNQAQPAVAILRNGTFVIVWQSDGAIPGIFGQRYSAVGAALGAQFRINTQIAPSISFPAVASTADGGFVVAWQAGAVSDVFAQRYTANGAKLGGEFGVNTWTAGAQSQPAVSAFDDGGFVVSGTSNGQDGSGLGVFAQIYNANGTRNGGEFGVNTTIVDNQSQPSAISFEDGNFVGVWASKNQDGSLEGVYGQRFDAGGQP